MRFIAYWDREKQHCNIPIESYEVSDSVVELYRKDNLIGMFDMGVLDIWYISGVENERV